MKSVWIASFLLLTACSSQNMSEQQCRSSDWYSVGVTDAWHGELQNKSEQYQEQCSSYGVNANLKEWQRGYLSALHKQCPAQKALDIVIAQKTYDGPCLADPEFKQALMQDAEKAKTQLRINQIEQRLSEIEKEKILSNKQKGQDLGWEEYQLQQELLDIKGAIQIADPEPINKF